jgi:DsbC/DsbD-like thiol-disulfide interchange protein
MLMLRSLIFALCTLLPLVAADPQPLDIQLVSDVQCIGKDQPFYLGLALKHARGYHTYWQHPGIVGVPTNIEWEPHPGFKIEPITWPEPEHVLMFKIHAQGYERDVVLPMKVTPTGNAKGPFTFRGKATWMCCNQECNPGLKELSITLPIAEVAAPDEKWSQKIQGELALQPQPSELWTCRLDETKASVVLHLQPKPEALPLDQKELKDLRYFTLDGYIDSDKPQLFQLTESGGCIITLTKAEYVPGGKPKQLCGVIMRDKSWDPHIEFRGLRLTQNME